MNASINASKSLTFNYSKEDYVNWIKNLREQFADKKFEDRIHYPEDFASGFARTKIIEPGLSYRIVDYTLNSHLDYNRVPTNEFCLMLYFYELEFEEKVYCRVGSTVLESNDKFYSVALMTHNHTDQHVSFKKGTSVKGLSVKISEEWLKKNIKDFTPAKLELIKQQECIINFISTKQRKILYDIFSNDAAAFLPELFVKSRVLRLTEQFLTNLCNMGLYTIPEFTNQKDFQSLLKIEHLLLKNFNMDFPSIETLAKTAYMSESKLKKLFKKAYGMAPYEYYQKNRMHKAKELLRLRTHKISEVGALLGYQNMSNFSAAFKKEFDYLPSQAHQVF